MAHRPHPHDVPRRWFVVRDPESLFARFDAAYEKLGVAPCVGSYRLAEEGACSPLVALLLAEHDCKPNKHPLLNDWIGLSMSKLKWHPVHQIAFMQGFNDRDDAFVTDYLDRKFRRRREADEQEIEHHWNYVSLGRGYREHCGDRVIDRRRYLIGWKEDSRVH